MKNLSTGDDSTLASYRKLAAAFLGEESKAVAFLDKKIADSPNGSAEEVLADEGQMVHMLVSLG